VFKKAVFSLLILLLFLPIFLNSIAFADTFNAWMTDEIIYDYPGGGRVHASGHIYLNWFAVPGAAYYIFLRDGINAGTSDSPSGRYCYSSSIGDVYDPNYPDKIWPFWAGWENNKKNMYSHTWQVRAVFPSPKPSIYSNIIRPFSNPASDPAKQVSVKLATTVGEPINVANGQMSTSKTDILIPAKGIPLELTRCYNNQDNYQGPFGRAWRSNFDINLSKQADNSVIETGESGVLTIYTSNGDNTYTPSAGKYSVLTKNANGTYTVLRKHGRKLYFDNMGRLTKIEDRNGNYLNIQRTGEGAIAQVSDISGRALVFVNDTHGQVTQITDPSGRIFTYEYDSAGNLIKTADPLNNQTIYQYDNFHNLIKETDPLNHALNFEYDALYRAYHSWQDDNNNVVSLSYDPDNKTTIVTDSLGKTTKYEYNDYGLVTKITDSQNNTQISAWDSQMNKTSTMDQNSNTTTYTYDDRGNLLTVTDPLNNTTTFTYKPDFEFVETITDAKSNVYNFTYDAHGNLASSRDPDNQTTNFEYDPSGQLTSITDAKSGVTSFTYDTFGNLIRMDDPLGKFATYGYDTLGRLVTLTDPKSNSFSYQYNAINQLTQVTYPDATIINYTYNYSNLMSIQDTKGTMSFTYDSVGRMKSFTNYDAKVVSYDYDTEGNLLKLTYPDNKAVNYAYDEMNRLKKVTDWLNNVTEYNYDPRGNLSSSSSPGLITTYKYDVLGRLVKLLNYNANTTNITSAFEFTLDDSGNRTNISKYLPLISPFFNLANTSYTYNSANQLVSATNQSFTYDDNGNMLTHENSGTPGNRSFTYNYDNQLSQYTANSGNLSFQYDALGNRINKTKYSIMTKYIIDPNRSLPGVLCETTSSGIITSYYVYGLGLISKIQGANAYFYQYDGIGSTVAITDKNGIIKNKYDYDDFGNVATNSTETTSNSFKYVGKYGVITDAPDLLYMRARYYSPSIGRFINKDPIGLMGGMNLYGYVGGNPINLVDPYGLCPKQWAPDWIQRLVPSYGNYGGPNNTDLTFQKIPIDSMDELFMEHDRSWASNEYGSADKKLISDWANLPINPYSWKRKPKNILKAIIYSTGVTSYFFWFNQ